MNKVFCVLLAVFFSGTIVQAQTENLIKAAKSINAPGIDLSGSLYYIAVGMKGTQLVYQAKSDKLETTNFVISKSIKKQTMDVHNTKGKTVVKVNLPAGFRIKALKESAINSTTGRISIILEPIPKKLIKI